MGFQLMDHDSDGHSSIARGVRRLLSRIYVFFVVVTFNIIL